MFLASLESPGRLRLLLQAPSLAHFLLQKTLLSLQATTQHQITTAKRALGYQPRFLGDLVHSEMVRDMVGHSGPSFLSTSEVRF